MRILILCGLLSAASVLGCVSGGVPVPGPEGSDPSLSQEATRLVPPGYGTLLQDQISLRLQRGELLIKVTPLQEWVIRLTAPDTYERLKGLAAAHGPRATRTAMVTEPNLFLVSFFSYQPNVTYQPEDLLMVNRGLRFRPEGIAPITPSWDTQRLGQQETSMAVYAFGDGLDLEADLIVEYQDLRNEVWRERILPLLEAERAKVRARAGGMPPS